jgi:DNA-binding response OmpR family regulator
MTVLIVDDEPSDLEPTRKALEGEGFQVLGADSYDSALEIFEPHARDVGLAVLDVSLPGRNGVELYRELEKRNPAIKVLFVSGHVGAEVIRFYGLEATDRHFLQKPFEAHELIERVGEIVRVPQKTLRPKAAARAKRKTKDASQL